MLTCWRRRELDEVLSLTEMGAEVLSDLRLGTNKQHGLVPLLRQSIYSRVAPLRRRERCRAIGVVATGYRSVQRVRA